MRSTDDASYECVQMHCEESVETTCEAWGEIHHENPREVATTIPFETYRDSVVDIMYPDIREAPLTRQCEGCLGMPCEKCIVTTCQGAPVCMSNIQDQQLLWYKTTRVPLEFKSDYLYEGQYPGRSDLELSKENFCELQLGNFKSISRETETDQREIEITTLQEYHNESSLHPADLENADLIRERSKCEDDLDRMQFVREWIESSVGLTLVRSTFFCEEGAVNKTSFLSFTLNSIAADLDGILKKYGH